MIYVDVDRHLWRIEKIACAGICKIYIDRGLIFFTISHINPN